ncbi:hypothetical protein BAE44_0010465, partial [Dichanthelium oligosanthes]
LRRPSPRRRRPSPRPLCASPHRASATPPRGLLPSTGGVSRRHLLCLPGARCRRAASSHRQAASAGGLQAAEEVPPAFALLTGLPLWLLSPRLPMPRSRPRRSPGRSSLAPLVGPDIFCPVSSPELHKRNVSSVEILAL